MRYGIEMENGMKKKMEIWNYIMMRMPNNIIKNNVHNVNKRYVIHTFFCNR